MSKASGAPGMDSADEARLIEILLTHNEPVSCDDLACALGIRRAEVQVLATRLQTKGFAVVDTDNDTVAATAAADPAVHTAPD
jgi:biotin operon repressor